MAHEQEALTARLAAQPPPAMAADVEALRQEVPASPLCRTSNFGCRGRLSVPHALHWGSAHGPLKAMECTLRACGSMWVMALWMCRLQAAMLCR